jgi:TonB family protein
MSAPGHTFGHHLFWVSLTHAVLIGLILGISFIPGCEGPPDTATTLVELIVPDFPGEDVPPDTGPAGPVQPDPAPPAPPAPRPPAPAPPDTGGFTEPAKPKDKKPKAESTAKPPEKKTEVRKDASPQPGKILVSKTLVKRPSRPGSKTKLSAEEIQRLLDRGAKIGKPTLSDNQLRTLVDSTSKYGPGTAMTQDMVYMEVVRQTLYKAWDQPTEIGIGGLVARVELSLDPDGTLTGSRMTAGSGNRVMDESVMRAVRSVRRISRVPAEFLRAHRRIVVAFELTGNG